MENNPGNKNTSRRLWLHGTVHALVALSIVVLLVFLALRYLPIYHVAMAGALIFIHLGTLLILIPSTIARWLRKRNFDSTQRLAYRVVGAVLIALGWLQAFNLVGIITV